MSALLFWASLVSPRANVEYLKVEACNHGVRRQSLYEKRDEELSRQVPFEVGMVLATRIRSADMCNADAPRCCQLRIASSFAVAQLLCNRPTQPSRPHTFRKLASFGSPFFEYLSRIDLPETYRSTWRAKAFGAWTELAAPPYAPPAGDAMTEKGQSLLPLFAS